jgi:sulfate permease, SulP family
VATSSSSAFAWVRELRDARVLRADALAGLTGAIVVLPQGVAFATLAGMPPQYGLYAAMIPCIVAALLGSSRLMVTGPANAISLTVLALIAPLATPESARYVSLVITLTFLVGALTFVLALARAGTLTRYVSHTVIVGFTTGAAILIINSQIGNFFGLPIERGKGVFETVRAFVATVAQTHLPSLLVGIVTLVAGLIAKRWNRIVPYMLVAMIVGALCAIGVSAWLASNEPIRTVSALPGALPPLSLPDFSLNTMKLLALPALVMTVLAVSEAISVAQAAAKKKGHAFDANREMFGQGVANIVGSFFSAYPASGSFNRTGVNLESNAQTPFAAICAALLLVALLFFVAPYAKFLPYPAMAAILFLVAWGLIDRREVSHLLGDAYERIVFLVTFLATMMLSLEIAIGLGILVSLVVARLKPTLKPPAK